MSGEQISAILLDGRPVPFPTTISQEARAYLASMVGPDGRILIPAMAMPPADDHAMWDAVKTAANEGMAQRHLPLAAASSATTETIRVGGTVMHKATAASGIAAGGYAYLYMHGGALLFGEGEYCRLDTTVQADWLGVTAYGVDYRTPPRHPYPAALDDCLAAYEALLADYAPENIIIGGQSAGGNLAAATILRARDEGLPLPAGAVLITPELDLTETGDSFNTHQGVDPMLPGPLMEVNLLYANGHDLSDPYVSPLFGDFAKGFPPTFLQAGTRDLFLSNVARMQRSLRRAGVPVEVEISEGMPHGGFFGAPEDFELAGEIRKFMSANWARQTGGQLNR